MKIKDYAIHVRTRNQIPLDNIAYSFIGLGGEVGECLEWYKKAEIRGDKGITTKDLQNELGDVLHYMVRICEHYGWTLKDCMDANVEKLDKRYGRS